MTWFKVDDSLINHPKWLIVGLHARALWVQAGIWSAGQLTDGRVDKALLDYIAACAKIPTGKAKAAAAELVAARLWEDTDTAWVFHDWAEHQPSRTEVLTRRNKVARKRKLYEDRELLRQVRARDGDVCRYCGIDVKWRDRKGTTGGTYDHIDPDGLNELDNVVVACRGCNSRKKDRTPEEAGMRLRPLEPRRFRADNTQVSPKRNLVTPGVGSGREICADSRGSDQAESGEAGPGDTQIVLTIPE